MDDKMPYFTRIGGSIDFREEPQRAVGVLKDDGLA